MGFSENFALQQHLNDAAVWFYLFYHWSRAAPAFSLQVDRLENSEETRTAEEAKAEQAINPLVMRTLISPVRSILIP